ncbi:S8 family serine peptidase [Endozoicomonas sp. Mp262]|uniref:S8 family peptidase n=1 Tax=Endozoicomonas sp. Mp262 TaxID=2919499 RepID=UPI0021D8B4A8
MIKHYSGCSHFLTTKDCTSTTLKSLFTLTLSTHFFTPEATATIHKPDIPIVLQQPITTHFVDNTVKAQRCLTPPLPSGTADCLVENESFHRFGFSFLSGVFSGAGINPWVLLSGAGAGIAAAAAGGGGGGGGSGSGSSNGAVSESSPINNDNVHPTEAAHYETVEYSKRSDLNVINAKEAYANIASLIGRDSSNGNITSNTAANGATQGGEGITIAILDTGVDSNHVDLSANIKKDCLTTSSCQTHYGSSDPDGHGSHVAGIAAGRKNGLGIHGVAYNSTLLPGCAYLGGGCSDSYVSDAGLMQWAASNGATVANMSYAYTQGYRTKVASDVTGGITNYNDPNLKRYLFGSYNRLSGSEYQQARQALEKGLVTVLAAGNYNIWSQETSQPSVMAVAPLIYAKDDIANDLAYQWIAAVNTRLDGSLSSSSHACGDAAEFCLAAPGTNITSTVPGNQYTEYSGTSMAAPQITGAVALVAGAFPGLELPSSHKYASFCDSGSAHYNSKQCHSKAVVNRLFTTATDIGDPGIDAVYGQGLLNLEGATSLIGEAQLQTRSGATYTLSTSDFHGSPAINGDITRQLSGIRLIAVDSYDKAGFLYSGSALSNDASPPHKRVDTLQYLNRSLYSDSLSTTTLSPGLTLGYSSNNHHDDLASGSYKLSYTLTPSARLNISYGLKDHHNLPVASQAFSGPLSQFSHQAHGVSYQQRLSDNYTLTTRFQKATVSDYFNEQQDSLQTTRFDVTFSGSLSDRLKGKLLFGSLQEEESLLGSYGSGIWNSDQGSQSFMVGISLDYRINNNLDALFSYYQTKTKARQQQGLLDYSDHLLGDSFSAGLLAKVNNNNKWHYGFFVTQPLRVHSGSGQLELPTGYQGNNLSYSTTEIHLTPDGRHMEYEFALGWESDPFPVSGKLNLIRVEDYGNIKGNDDTLLILSLGAKF